MKIQKAISILFVILFFPILIFSEPLDNVKEYTLENGLKVVFLEDSSDALVHIDLSCRAGFSSQTQQNCGFFKLYSRLVQNGNPALTFSDVQCSADTTRYLLNTTAQSLPSTLTQLSDLIFSPEFTDELLAAQLNQLKKEVTENADSMSTLINGAIDSRVFSDSPWKHDSGVYPALFNQTTQKSARNIIKDISDRWYIPQNCALFISGNINSEKLLVYLKQSFGRFYSSYKTPSSPAAAPLNSKRKFVFHDSEISSDLTQIVIQYTMLDNEEAELLAATLNNDYSGFKQQLLNLPQLNIPGAEYIDVSSARQKGSTRLIIQSLMQPAQNSKNKVTSFSQVQDFLQLTKKTEELFSSIELQYGKRSLESKLAQNTANPLTLINCLSDFWSTGEQFYETQEEDYQKYPDSVLASLMMSRSDRINRLDTSTLTKKLNAEEPFVFVIINSKDYKANKKEYAAAGFEEINKNNSSWYSQTLFKEIREQFKNDDTYVAGKNSSDNGFYTINLAQIKNSTLSNGIKVVSKKNDNSKGITLLLSIKGGKLNSSDDNGMEEVMTNLLAGIIQKEIYKKQVQGLVVGAPEVSSQTNLSSSFVIINFDPEDALEVTKAISQAVIYGEIAPASADKAVSSRQYKKRLENGSAANQLYSEAIKTIYGKSAFSKIFDTKEDVLTTTNYNSILASYPALLDADRYSLILTGNFNDDIFAMLDASFSLFANNNLPLTQIDSTQNIPSNKKLTVQIQHTFLTDIPAEEAGPQPAVLVPTTEFLDPVIYILPSPQKGTKEAALFNAILNQLEIELQNQIDSNTKLKGASVAIQLPKSKMDFGTIIVQNVSHTKELDSVYRQTIQNLSKKMQNGAVRNSFIQEIKNNWILNQMAETYTNAGTASLIQKGFELFPEAPQPDFYLKEYEFIQNAEVQDYFDALDFFPQRPDLRVYSKDGKD